VSLINEALRKARQAASEHDSKQAEGAFQPARAYPSRRSGRRSGLSAMALIAVAAGVVGAGAAWWLLGDREPASTDTTVVERPSIEAPTPLATPEDSSTPAEDRVEPVAVEVPNVPAATPVVVPAPEQDPVELESPAPAAEEPPTDPDGGRVFVMEAELGYASLSLGYIVARSSNPFAEINGTEVWIDSEIEGFVVEAIESDRVILRDDKGLLVLRVP
jgi:hypothetical protein